MLAYIRLKSLRGSNGIDDVCLYLGSWLGRPSGSCFLMPEKESLQRELQQVFRQFVDEPRLADRNQLNDLMFRLFMNCRNAPGERGARATYFSTVQCRGQTFTAQHTRCPL